MDHDVVRLAFRRAGDERGMDLRSLAAVALLAGCAHSPRDRDWVAGELDRRLGPGPDGVDATDGIDEVEVVRLALWQSPAIRAELTRIDAAQASVAEARRPANPQLSLLAPFGPISAVATLAAPLESLWQLPARTKAAARDADVVGETTLLTALDLVRDARLLHVELGLAADRAAIRAELADIAAEVARVARSRAALGDLSAQDEALAEAEAHSAEDAKETAELEVLVVRERLVAALALDEPPRAVFSDEPGPVPARADLVAIARQARPDAHAADLALEAATARGRFERSRALAVSGQGEAHWSVADGPAARLGARVEVPVFGFATVGGVRRAAAELARATAQHEVVARRIVLDVTAAHARVEQADASAARFDRDVLPALASALAAARSGFALGDTPPTVLLEILRRTAEARLRRAELAAEQRRARCELERAIGARFGRAEGAVSEGGAR